MKIKVNTAVERDLVVKWLGMFGIGHSIDGFTVKFSDMEESLLGVFLSAPEMNDGVSIRHLFEK